VISESTIPLREQVSLERCYFLWCFLFALAVRAVVFVFLAADNFRKRKATDPQTYWRTYWDCWNGITGRHVDLWLPFAIGFAELCAYPVLMRSQQFTAIGAWLAIRTAGSWRGWTSHRTSYYRFLLGNVLNLAISYVVLSKYVTIGK